MMLAILPASIKDPHTKKYFDWMAEFELNDLFHTGKSQILPVTIFVSLSIIVLCAGVDGVKVKIFSTSMDTPGRSELMGTI